MFNILQLLLVYKNQNILSRLNIPTWQIPKKIWHFSIYKRYWKACRHGEKAPYNCSILEIKVKSLCPQGCQILVLIKCKNQHCRTL